MQSLLQILLALDFSCPLLVLSIHSGTKEIMYSVVKGEQICYFACQKKKDWLLFKISLRNMLATVMFKNKIYNVHYIPGILGAVEHVR